MTTLQQQARALGDPTRHAIFSLLAESDRALGVSELTDRFALNHNAIRQHLARLVDADLVVERKAPPVGRGRPPFEYVINPVAKDQWGNNGPYEQLSHLLAEIITSGQTPEEVGRRAADRLRVATPSGDVVADIGVAMARQGFDPEIRDVDGGVDMVLHNCPFSTTAIDARDTVCSLHLGIAEGLVEGTDVHVEELVARDPARAECCLRIRVGGPEREGTGGSAGAGRLTLQRPAS